MRKVILLWFNYINILNIPNEINNAEEMIFQVLFGILEFLTIFFPINMPKDINIIWNPETSIGK